MQKMSKNERALLLAVSRIMRARLAAAVAQGDPNAKDDLWGLQEALKPFEPVGGELINAAAREHHS